MRPMAKKTSPPAPQEAAAPAVPATAAARARVEELRERAAPPRAALPRREPPGDHRRRVRPCSCASSWRSRARTRSSPARTRRRAASAGEPAEGFATVAHAEPMLSLENAYSWEEARGLARAGDARRSGEEPRGFVAELKIDGLSISLRYEGGRLVRGATRGDGVRGEDVTGNVRTIRTVPLRIAETAPLEVRGEVYYSKKAFERVNAEREAEGEPLFANPRNAAAGTMRLLDSRITARRRLDAWLYSVVEATPMPASQSEALERLRGARVPGQPALAALRDLRGGAGVRRGVAREAPRASRSRPTASSSRSTTAPRRNGSARPPSRRAGRSPSSTRRRRRRPSCATSASTSGGPER